MSASTRRRSDRIASKPEPTTPSMAPTYSDDGEEEDGSEEEESKGGEVKDEPAKEEQREPSIASSASTSTKGGKLPGGTGRPRGRPPKKKNKQAAVNVLPSPSPYSTSTNGKGKESTIVHLSPTVISTQNNNNNHHSNNNNKHPNPPPQPSYLTHAPLAHRPPPPLPSLSAGGILTGGEPLPFPIPPLPHLQPLHQQGMIHLPLGVGSAQYQHFEHAPPSSSSSSGLEQNVDPRSLGLDPSSSRADVRSRAPSDAFTSGSQSMSMGMGMGMGGMHGGIGGPEGPYGGGVVGGPPGQQHLVGGVGPGGELLHEDGLTRLYRDIGRILYVDMRESQDLLAYLIGQIQQNANAFDRSIPPERQGPAGRAILDALAGSACVNIQSVKKIYAGPGGRGGGWEAVGIWLVTKAFDVWIGNHLP